jgi:signal transduction histidine kinase
VAALALAAVWNHTLRRLAERRGRLLYKTKLESAAADLRVEERTRLAVELHDSIAQTLTGVSFQIDAAERTLPRDAEDAAGYIDAARKALLSCREELRRCLWDLRSETLAEPDLQNAIEKTIRPHIQNADVVIRFHASRHRIPDVIAHNVLSIIRELCVNAVKHGNAHKIRIAGELKNGALRFVVRDDGCGFDVENRPGPMQGHFGLQGIKERTRRLRGTLKLDSEIGKGTAATVEIPL